MAEHWSTTTDFNVMDDHRSEINKIDMQNFCLKDLKPDQERIHWQVIGPGPSGMLHKMSHM